MEHKTSLKYFLFFLLLSITNSCVEEVAVESEVQSSLSVEDILVVDATLTDEVKNHEVQLTRIFALQGEEPIFETGAQIHIIDSQGGQFSYEEIGAGTYRSISAFAAEHGKSYRLEITTANGKKYVSSEVAVPKAVPIGDIRAQRITNDREEEGVGIFLDNDPDGDDPTFFRYEYEETYKIIAPKWDPFRLRVVRYEPCFSNPFVVDIIPWEDERRICFGGSSSRRLIQASSAELGGNTIDNFQLHFISRENYIISHRYSMNVTQYAQTSDAYSFYERLGDFSSLDNVFSQVQPGFLEGNIALESNPEELALGYFEVTSVSKKRMYFNYEDLFPGEALPPYAVNCENLGNPRLWPEMYHCASTGVCDGNCVSPLIEGILLEQLTFASEKEDDFLSPYYTWPSPCGDCTQIGSNVVPEFWEE
ncbi:MAG: DUF4249 domain-containing protein [Bacteroidota bacterium]